MIECIKNKKIGIWGFGVTGQSVLRYLSTIPSTDHPSAITIFEPNKLSDDLLLSIKTHNALLATHASPLEFIKAQDIIIASPGIDLDPYREYSSLFMPEIDLFHGNNTKKTIAITGSAGKTSITHLLGQIIQSASIKIGVGGNIGTGMLDLLAHNDDMRLLELSSFQLEYSTQFAPDLAIITNVYPNHLDRHKTMDRYFKAKYNLVLHQKSGQHALIPLSLIDHCNNAQSLKSIRSFFSWDMPTDALLYQLKPSDRLFFIKHNAITLRAGDTELALFPLDRLPSVSFKENWLIIVSALHILTISLDTIDACKESLELPEHRLELVATINSINFYNDSKSTTNQATITAVNALTGHNSPIHLLLGGISKGVDRTPLIECLKDRVTHVYCFGKEAEELHELCRQRGIASSSSATLEEAFDRCIKNIHPGDQLLFSPGGASFDLFKDYQERGTRFKQLVQGHVDKSCIL